MQIAKPTKYVNDYKLVHGTWKKSHACLPNPQELKYDYEIKPSNALNNNLIISNLKSLDFSWFNNVSVLYSF